jgi:Kef-type K+ transport system membrane component KefB
LFGRLAPEYYHLVFNQQALSSLSGIGSMAVLVFGLITGLHLDPAMFREDGRATSIVAAAGVVVPTALGGLAGFWILARHQQELAPGIDSVEFVAAVGICTGVTALPVLGVILGEMDAEHSHRSPRGGQRCSSFDALKRPLGPRWRGTRREAMAYWSAF